MVAVDVAVAFGFVTRLAVFACAVLGAGVDGGGGTFDDPPVPEVLDMIELFPC